MPSAPGSPGGLALARRTGRPGLALSRHERPSSPPSGVVVPLDDRPQRAVVLDDSSCRDMHFRRTRRVDFELIDEGVEVFDAARQ